MNTGGPYFAPPIPYGCYAKDYLGAIHNGIGLAKGSLFGLFHHGLCKHCGGKGCGLCGDDLCGGCGGKGCGLCGGRGLFHHGGDPCAACGGSGCGFCRGLGLFGGHARGCDPVGGGCGLGGGGFDLGDNGSAGHASTAAATDQGVVIPAPHSPCGKPGCTIAAKHHHRRLGRGCDACGGIGCSLCGGREGLGDPCGACGGRGCGRCGGRGLLGGTGCGACGGVGCKLCAKGHALLGLPHALVNKVLHRGEIKYFVGAGGPVPITPGYVPYVVTTRSPRDFLAFPPYVDIDP